MARFQSSRDRLTPAADATIAEYAARLRADVLDEASALNQGDAITPEDVVNAFGSLEARKRGPVLDKFGLYLLDVSIRRDRLTAMWLFVALLALVFNVINGAFLSLGIVPSGEWWILFTLAISAVGVGALTVAAMLLLRSFQDRRTFMMRNERVRAAKTGSTGSITSVLPSLSSSGYMSSGRDIRGRDGERERDGRMDLLLLSLWIDVEKDLRKLATLSLGISEEDARGYPIGELLKMLHRVNVIDEDVLARTRSMLNVRNNLVHARQRIDDAEQTAKAMHSLRSRTRELVEENSIDPDTYPLDSGVSYRPDGL